MPARPVLLPLSLVLLTAACAGAAPDSLSQAPDAAPFATLAAGDYRARGSEEAGFEEPDPHAVIPRLIRTGSMSVVVSAYEPFQRDLSAWLARAQGHVADANLSHVEGDVSWGSLTVRVPAESLDMLVGWVEEQVQVEQLTLNSNDVTAEWVDVQARIDNGERAELRLQELLATNTGTLRDVLDVERELARVRGEIEAAEGRMRVLSDQVGLSTLQVQVQVRTPYTASLAPSFSEDVASAFGGSVSALVRTLRGAALIGVAATPWVAPGLLLVLGLVLGVRRRGDRAAV